MIGPRSGAAARVETAPAVETAAIERLRHFGGDTLVAAMAASFVAYAPDRLGVARDAAAGGDCDAVRAATHSLKSSAGQLGATAMQRLCERTETLAAEGVAAALPPLVAAIQASFDAAAIELLALTTPNDPLRPPTTGAESMTEESC